MGHALRGLYAAHGQRVATAPDHRFQLLKLGLMRSKMLVLLSGNSSTGLFPTAIISLFLCISAL